GPQPGRRGDELLLADRDAIDLDPLAERAEVRRGVEARDRPGPLEHGGQHGGDGPLPVRPADVERAVREVWVAHGREQPPRPLQPPADPAAQAREQLPNDLAISEGGQSSEAPRRRDRRPGRPPSSATDAVSSRLRERARGPAAASST